jgi:peptidoglycan/LPS O-acetylase OafA/YrhL
MRKQFFKWKHFSERDTLLFKSFGILFIMAHNFFHLIKPLPGENEFSFTKEKFASFIQLLGETPEDFIRITMSYLGHYGVQIFIFLSAYGLTRKYFVKGIRSGNFIKKRLLRLYPGFILAIGFYLFAGFFFYGALGPAKVFFWKWDAILYKVLMISSYIPGQSLSPVGPWWFLPFIVSFYMVFPFLLKILKWKGPIPIILIGALSYIPIITLYPILLKQEVNLFFMVLGHLPEFCIGMIMARDEIEGSNFLPYFLIACAVFVLSNFFSFAWFFGHLAAMIMVIFLFKGLLLLVKQNGSLEKIFFFIGNISFHIFLINGFTREPWDQITVDYDHWFMTIIFGLVSMSISIATAYLLYRLEKYLVLKIKNKYNEHKLLSPPFQLDLKPL